MAQPHISVAAETITTIGSFPITNSLISTWVVMTFLFIFGWFAGKNVKKRPDRFQVFVELVVGGMYDFFRKLGGKHGDKFAPLIITFFFFIVISNWFGLLPGVGTIGFFEKQKDDHTSNSLFFHKVVAGDNTSHDNVNLLDKTHTEIGNESEATDAYESFIGEAGEQKQDGKDKHTGKDSHHGPKFVPLFRGPTADLNTTLGLGIIAFFAIQYFGLSIAGVSYIKRFLDFRSPIYLFVGILEAVSDLSKILSFGFRLFGNIFAGEVLLAIMAFLFAFLLPIPFYGLEIFVGLVQGLVFAMLTTVFTTIAVAHGEHMSGHHGDHAHEGHHS